MIEVVVLGITIRFGQSAKASPSGVPVFMPKGFASYDFATTIPLILPSGSTKCFFNLCPRR